jgi:hypothetical protein
VEQGADIAVNYAGHPASGWGPAGVFRMRIHWEDTYLSRCSGRVGEWRERELGNNFGGST